MGKQSSYGNQTPTGSDYVTGVKGTSTASFLFSAILTYIGGAIMAVLSNPYKFSVYLTGDQTITTGVETVVAFNTEFYDTNNNLNAATGRYTVPVTGFYRFNAVLNTSTGAANLGALMKNGVSFIRLSQINALGYAGGSVSIPLTAGDYIEVIYFQNSGGNQTVYGFTGGVILSSFSGELISKT